MSFSKLNKKENDIEAKNAVISERHEAAISIKIDKHAFCSSLVKMIDNYG